MVARGKLGVDLFQDNSNHTSQSCSVAPNEDHLNDGPQYFFLLFIIKTTLELTTTITVGPTPLKYHFLKRLFIFYLQNMAGFCAHFKT